MREELIALILFIVTISILALSGVIELRKTSEKFILITLFKCEIIEENGSHYNSCGTTYPKHYIRPESIKSLTPMYYQNPSEKLINIEYCRINGLSDVEQTCSEIIKQLE